MPRADAAAHLEAVDAREHHVEEDDVVGLDGRDQALERQRAVLDVVDGDAVGGEIVA